jgi:hypothetical protein
MVAEHLDREEANFESLSKPLAHVTGRPVLGVTGDPGDSTSLPNLLRYLVKVKCLDGWLAHRRDQRELNHLPRDEDVWLSGLSQDMGRKMAPLYDWQETIEERLMHLKVLYTPENIPWPPATSEFAQRMEAALQQFKASKMASSAQKTLSNLFKTIHGMMSILQPVFVPGKSSTPFYPFKLERELALVILWSPLMVVMDTTLDKCTVTTPTIFSVRLSPHSNVIGDSR